jgi:hypothetical protein
MPLSKTWRQTQQPQSLNAQYPLPNIEPCLFIAAPATAYAPMITIGRSSRCTARPQSLACAGNTGKVMISTLRA